ncbi:MAG: hypothetical protein LBG52_09265 [Candidatus Peribacteria bacterium]|jgi:UDP-N-acetylmuramyl tripeptide synthase|nr:hypothetical protein [Candidatus Peribacteria bacterium]
MELFAKGIKKKNASVNKILYRKDAMKKAIEESQAGDVVVIIVNDPIKTGEYIKNLLQIT